MLQYTEVHIPSQSLFPVKAIDAINPHITIT
jgi:hypothetical protein